MRFIMAGDFSPTEQNMSIFERKDIQTLFGEVPGVFPTADRAFVNLECVLTTSDSAIPKFGPHLKAAPVCAEVLREIGVTDCGLSNNHIFDYGIAGLRETMKHLDENGILWTGVGENDTDSRKPHIIHIQNKTISLIAVCEHEYSYALPDRIGANPYDPYDTMEDIRMVRKSSDYVIVIYHGGKEHCRYPSPRLRKLCRAMVQNGADVILCQHSHCIGCYEKYEGSHILYGQGNFHFVTDSPYEGWYSGLIVVLDIDHALNVSFLPVVINPEHTGILLAEGAEQQKLLSEFEERNKKLQSDLWLGEWKQFCKSLREPYLSAIAKAYVDHATERDNQHFGHYLDCEAHTDVWKTLCTTWNQTNER